MAALTASMTSSCKFPSYVTLDLSARTQRTRDVIRSVTTEKNVPIPWPFVVIAYESYFFSKGDGCQ